LDESGYILAVLLVGMAVAAVWMAALLPAWRHQAMREREEELIFRGNQYARAIALYYRKNNSQLPPNLDALIHGHFLRKKWLDPVTGEEFLYLGAQAPGQLSSPASGTPGGAGQPGQPGSIIPPPGTPLGMPQQAGRTGLATPPPTGPQGQIIPGMYGVQSRSSATSIKVFQGQQQHNLWRFDFREAQAQMGLPAPAGGGPRGGPGTGGPRGGPGTGGPRGGPGIGPGRSDLPPGRAGPGRAGPGQTPPRGGAPPPRGSGSEP
jgi:type II secretory pathway pseudopilin PulG